MRLNDDEKGKTVSRKQISKIGKKNGEAQRKNCGIGRLR